MGSPRETAISIWHAGVEVVTADRLIESHVAVDDEQIKICGVAYPLSDIGKVCVVGAGKAAGYLAAALERALQTIVARAELHGWVNVPGNGVPATNHIRLHVGRPAGVNEPREEGVQGAKQILSMVSSLAANDLCICLLTGGGSALLPAPRAGVTLDDKLLVTRLMSANGASIQELNRVRTALSDIKGGGLRRACLAKRLTTLIVSDVIGDPLDVIASGPTFLDTSSNEAPVDVLRRFARKNDLPPHVWRILAEHESSDDAEPSNDAVTRHHILANNASAVNAAAEVARSNGLAVQIIPPESPDMTAEEVAGDLMAEIGRASTNEPTCFIWGGEPVVKLAPESVRGSGGRNQQLVLEVLRNWESLSQSIRDRLCVLSGGTDGEDGPTDAAGAFCDRRIADLANEANLDMNSYVERNDAYTFFDQVGGLIRTGPTHTNVCDLRVAVIQ